MENITQTFIENENLINSICWKFYNIYGGSFDEWKSEASLQFIYACQKYKKSKGKLITWIYYSVWKALLTYNRKQIKQQKRMVYIAESEIALNRISKTNNKIALLGLVDEASDDIKMLIHLICYPPSEICEYDNPKGKPACRTRLSLVSYLKTNLKWTKKEIKESLKELKELLCEN